MNVRMRRVATLNTSLADCGALPYVALENIESWTGALANELPVRDAPDNGAASVQPGDVLFGKLRPYLAKSWLSDRRAYASTELLCLRACEGIEPRWLAYVCNSRPVVDWAVATSDGTKMPRTSWEKLSELRCDPPVLRRQRAIADHLDTGTARIDALITKKRRMVELLDEEQWARRTHLVLGASRAGPSQPLLDVARIPEHWSVLRIRHCVSRVGVGVVVNPSSYFADEGVPFVHGSDVRLGWIDLQKTKRIQTEDSATLWRSRLDAGDVVVVRAGYPGRAAVVTEALAGANCASVLVLKRGEAILPEFLCHYMNSAIARKQVSMAQYGAAQEQINVSDIVDFRVPIPPVDEQRSIVGEIDASERRCRVMSSALQRQVELLVEHRQALITAAVAGELEVAGAA